jgi:hypothetical protein
LNIRKIVYGCTSRFGIGIDTASQAVSEIQQHLAEYMAGRIRLHEFEDWFVPVLWDLAEETDESARALGGRIHVVISEASRGDRSLDFLRDELKALCVSPVAPDLSKSVVPFVSAEGRPSTHTSNP